MNVNLKYCTIAAIIAVVLFSVTIGLLMNSGQASYTKSPETWYWTTMQNTSWVFVSGGWDRITSGYSEEAGQLTTSSGGTIHVPVYAVNPNPTLYVRAYTDTNSGHLRIFIDGRVGSKQTANISLYSSPTVNNAIFIIPTNLTRGYSTMNITLWANESLNDASISAMWLE